MKQLSNLVAYPYFLAFYPVVFIVARSPLEVTAASLATALAFAACCTLVISGLCRAILKNEHRAGLITSFLVVLFGYYGHSYRVLQTLPSPLGEFVRHRLLLVLAALCFAGLVYWTGRRTLTWTTPHLNLFSGLLLAMSVGQVVYIHAILPLERQLRPPLGALAPAPSGNRPSILVLVLDEYARADQLEKLFGYDNSAFVSALKQRGFHVPDRSNSNYSYTIPSLASLLNMEYLPEWSLKYVNGTGVSFWMTFLLDNRVTRFMRDSGYHVITLSYTSATDHFNASQENLGAGVLDNQFVDALLQGSIVVAYDALASLDRPRYVLRQRERTVEIFDKLERLTLDRPTFMFAHVLSPHRPLVFKADGSVVTAQELNAPGSYHKLYTEQIRYLNERTLKVVDRLLARTEDRPIILIISDHGSASSILPGSGRSFSAPNPAMVQERLGNLCALYTPGLMLADRKEFQHLSAVNLFRIILDHYFRTRLGLLENHYFWVSTGTQVTDWMSDGSND